jgi:hypothetical protein
MVGDRAEIAARADEMGRYYCELLQMPELLRCRVAMSILGLSHLTVDPAGDASRGSRCGALEVVAEEAVGAGSWSASAQQVQVAWRAIC